MDMQKKKHRGKMSPPPAKRRKRRGGKTKKAEMSREQRIKMGEDALGDQPF